MGIKERQERQRDEMRSLIIQAASDLITEEGLGSLSVRKIANRIEYSPAIIYHYFENKDQILQSLIMEQYIVLMKGFKAAEINTNDPIVIMKEFMKSYTNWALQNREVYTAIMFNNTPAILEFTGVLRRGIIRENRPAIKILTQTVKTLINGPEITDEIIELKVQVLWAAAFGLVVRMLIEDISPEQRERLIEAHIQLVFEGLRKV